MKVSVHMITYNHEKYIAQALESVLMQKVSFDYEIVIGEDCSTDKTRNIVLAYQKRHPDSIHVLLPEKNLGAMRNSIQTFNACKGEYIAGLEGDDYWTSPHKLQKQVDYMDSHPNCALCHHNIIKVYEDGSREPHHHNPPDQKEISTLDDLWEDNFIASCSAMVRRNVIDNLPHWFKNMEIGDWPMFILAAETGYIGYLNEVMGIQRIHHGGVWSKLTSIQQREKVIKFYKMIDACLESAYHEKIRARVAEEYYDLALEYEMNGDLSNARESVVRCIIEDPHCRRVPRREVYKTVLRVHAPWLHRSLAAIKSGVRARKP